MTKLNGQKFGLAYKKEENFSDWYTDLLLKSDMIDYYNLKGCYIMKPTSCYIWNQIKNYFQENIEKLGVEDSSFPMLITEEMFNKEKEHLESFAPELAWITKCGEEDLQQPLAIRPTSETIIYPSFAKWLVSHRDLPYKINQWCNVFRWEVKQTLPFIRAREFLWQEGHTCYLEKREAEKETLQILSLYKSIYEELLAVPVIEGRKTDLEKFGGADYTTTVEIYIPGSGKGVQGATSHHLGQNFSKMFNISVENRENEQQFVEQNCWGITTRTIGVAVMVHSDNIGLVLPPKVASVQAIIVLCGKLTDELADYANELCEKLNAHNIRAKIDRREKLSAGYKFNYWELRGIPLRIEIGRKDFENKSVTVVRRIDLKKEIISVENITENLSSRLNLMQDELFAKAKENLQNNKKYCATWTEFTESLNDGNINLAQWCGINECEENIRTESTVKNEAGEILLMGAKSLCIPFKSGHEVAGSCIKCDRASKHVVLFGRSY